MIYNSYNIRKFTLTLTFLIISFLIIGCTPGKSQLRSGNRAGRSEKYVRNENIENNKFNDDYNDDYKFEDESVRSGMKNKNRNDEYSGNNNQRVNRNYKRRNDENEFDDNSGENESSYKDDKRVMSSERYYQTGFASWYGREFQGKETASGEIFDMNDYTAAHKKLPFGTIVEIKNFDNGRSIKVRINDRGPYRGNRIIDLSYASAKRLGMISSGKAMIGIIVLKNGNRKIAKKRYKVRRNSNVEPVVNDNYIEENEEISDISVQAGAFYSKRNADNLKKQLEELTKKTVIVIHEDELYKVRIEGIVSKKDAKRQKRILLEENIKSYIINDRE